MTGTAARGMGVRVHLLVLALLALLPAWGLAGYSAWRFAGVERARLLGIAQDLARDIATGLEREVAAVRASLAALATSPALIAGDLVAFDRQLGLLYGGGALSVTLEPRRGDEAMGAEPALQREPPTGRPIVVFREAVTGTRSDAAQLVLRTDAARFWSSILRRSRLPQGWVAAVLDPNHVILARWPEPERFIGRPVHPDALAVLAQAGPDAAGGWGSGSTREGDPVRIAWHRVEGMPWTVLVGVPVDAVDGALHRAMLPVIVIGLPVLVGLSLATAFWASRRIAGPLRALEATAAEASRRGLRRSPPASGVREIDAAGRALAAAADHLREREAEVASLAARLESVLESTTDCVAVLGPDLAPIYLNGRARALLRSEAAESWSGLPLSGGNAFGEGFERAFRTGMPVSVTAQVAGEGAASQHWFTADAFPSPQGLTVFFRDVTAARAAEEAVRASEARLQAVLDHVPVGVLLAEAPTGRIVLTNRRIAEILGVPEVQAERFDGYESFPAFDAEGRPVPPAARAVARALTGEAPVRDEYRFRRGDGRLVWARVMAAPIRDERGRVTGVVAAVADIEAERRSESALRESELRFRVLAETVPQIVWSSGPDGTLDYLNPRYYGFTGESDAVPLEEATLPIHPDDRATTGRAWHAALAGGTPYEAEYRLRRADGAWRWFVARALPVRDAEGTVRRWIGTANDVTELIETRQALERQVAAEAAAREAAVQAAEALAASEARFRGFAEASPDVVWMLDPGTDRLAYLSPAYEEIWGEQPPDPGEARLADLVRGLDPQDAALVDRLLPALLAGETVQAEVRIHRADGQLRWVRLTSFAIGERRAQGARVGGFARDITRRQEADQRQRMLIGELNHRVKNTLATVLALARQTERSARRAAALEPGGEERAVVEASFVADFQARLMALARGHDLLTASTWRGAMLREVAAAALSPWRDEEGGAARIELRGPAVWLAPRQALGLALAIHEMATNAVKHGALSTAEGRVAFTWERDATGRVEAHWTESDGPEVSPPVESGFGTRLLRHGLATELGAGSEIVLDYPSGGFRATMRFQPLRPTEVE